MRLVLFAVVCISVSCNGVGQCFVVLEHDHKRWTNRFGGLLDRFLDECLDLSSFTSGGEFRSMPFEVLVLPSCRLFC